jgi:hypothetical protein
VFDVGPPKTCQKFEIQCGQQVYNVTQIVELMEQCNHQKTYNKATCSYFWAPKLKPCA